MCKFKLSQMMREWERKRPRERECKNAHNGYKNGKDGKCDIKKLWWAQNESTLIYFPRKMNESCFLLLLLLLFYQEIFIKRFATHICTWHRHDYLLVCKLLLMLADYSMVFLHWIVHSADLMHDSPSFFFLEKGADHIILSCSLYQKSFYCSCKHHFMGFP